MKRKGDDSLVCSPRQKRNVTKLEDLETRSKAEITVGSDCSGLGAEIYALQKLDLGSRIRHKFASEMDAKTRAVYEANHPDVEKMYESCCLKDRRFGPPTESMHLTPVTLQRPTGGEGDVCRYGSGRVSRILRRVGGVPRVDHYVAGPPCGPWSLQGSRNALKDTGTTQDNSNRGLVLYDVAGYIVSRQPKTFIIEEVVGLATGERRPVFDELVKMLKDVTCRNRRVYHVEWKEVNSMEIGGVPQHRPRIYICGIDRSLAVGGPDDVKFDWPDEIQCPKLSDFHKPNIAPKWTPTSHVQQTNLVRLWERAHEETGKDPKSTMFVFDVSSSEQFSSNYMKERCPAITRSRAAGGGFYLSAWRRMTTVRDLTKLQGFPTDMQRATSTDRQFAMMLGNAMTVPVLSRIQKMILEAAGYIK